MMKKAFFLICILLIVSLSCSSVAFADSDEYIEIKSENVYLYSRTIVESHQDGSVSAEYSPLFVLPISFFVKIENEKLTTFNDHIMVSYNGVTGYIKKESVPSYTKKSDVKDPYLSLADFKLVSGATVYTDTSLLQSKGELESESEIEYISYYDGSVLLYYVKLSDDSFGYIRASNTNYPTRPNVKYSNDSEEVNDNKVIENKPIIEFFNNFDNNLLNWILSILILCCVSTYVILIFKRKSSSKRNNRSVEKDTFSHRQNDYNDNDDSQFYI